MRADDGFRHFFLTHYHADHYGGLRRTHFRPECKRFLYASPITANILQTEYQLDDSVLIRIPVGNPDGITVYENAELREPKPLVRVMACDANHCPGAVIFVFWVYATGQFVVHCGDMRYDPARMGIDPILTRLAASQHEPVVRVQYLHIDTTYSNPRYDFAPQQAVLQALTEAAQREAAQAPTLFLCGTYFIGKERVWTSLARALGTKVYVDPAWRRKRRVLVECMRLSPEEPSPYAALLTERIQESCVHLVRMADVQPNQLQRALRRAQTLGFRQLVGVMATGWCHSPVPESGSRRLDGRPAPKPTLLQRTPLPNNRFCVLYKLPYSEHSSCTELKAFIDWIRPNQIVPTVPTRATHLQRLLPK
jgi:DNA cross-link repair 1A protein